MHVKELAFSLLLLMQACGPLLAQTPAPTEAPAEYGRILHRLMDTARGAKSKVEDIGSVALELAGEYYEDHIQPVAGGYVEWASGVRDSVWERLRTTIHDYSPFRGSQAD